MNNFNNVERFRGWCYKILPLVYDDSLSYYETLCKVVSLLNQVIENINNLPDYIAELLSDDKLKEILSTLLNTLEEQIASANEGTSEFASEGRNVGDLIWLNGELYRAIKQIDSGTKYVVGTNVDKVTIESVLNDINYSITPIRENNESIASANRTNGDIIWFNNKLIVITNDINEGERYVENNNYKNVNVAELITTIEELITTEKTERTNDVTRLNEQLVLVNNKIKPLNYVNIEDFGAVGDGVTDCTNAFVQAINEAKLKGKYVYVPVGKYRITETIALEEDVTISGLPCSNTLHGDDPSFNKSTIIIDTPANANTPAFTCYYGVCLENLRFEWKGNVSGRTPLDYGALVSSTEDKYGTNIMADCTFKNLMLVNASRGFYQKTGGRNIFSNIKADCTEYFTFVEQARDSNYYNTIHIFPFASTTDNVRQDYVFNHLNAFYFRNVDDMHISNVLIYKPFRGILCDTDSGESDYGSWIECDSVSVDGAKNESVYMAFPKYASFSNCRFNSYEKSSCCVFVQGQTQTKVQITGCSFWFAKVGVIHNGGKLKIANCTCEGNISTLVQSGGGCDIVSSDLYGNDNNIVPALCELDGQKLVMTSNIENVANLTATTGQASQVSINTTYKMHVLKFTTPNNDSYGIVNVGTDGSQPSISYKFRCNGGTYYIPIMCRAINAEHITTQIVLQSVSESTTLTDIQMIECDGYCDTMIDEIKNKTNSANTNFICSKFEYDGVYHAFNVTTPLTGTTFPEGSWYINNTNEYFFNTGSGFKKVHFEV